MKKEWLDDMIKFVVAKDKDSFAAYIACKKCIIMKGDMKVTVTDWPGVFGSTTGFIFKGTKFWTVREGINYNN